MQKRQTNVLFIATRAPYGRMHGHKMGMRTYIRSLQSLGYNVVVAAFDVPGDKVDNEDLGAPTRYLDLPGKLEILGNYLLRGLAGTESLNECLYRSVEARRQLRALMREFEVDIVVADMVRTAAYAHETGLPWLLDHEDLLSERYEMWARRSSGDENILGYLEGTVPAGARPLIRWIFKKTLGREAKVLARREVYWSDRAGASSLRSTEETQRLQRATRRPVFCMPVSVPIPEEAATGIDTRPMTAVFTGGLTYQPNLDALRAYVAAIIPEFQRQGVEIPTLNVIGAAPEALRNGIEHPTIRYLGYVPDVNDEVKKAQIFFAPIVSGTGIKTKVLEAMACGVPLLALPMGLVGLSGSPERDYMRASDPAEFVRLYKRLRDDPGLSVAIGAAGRQLAVSTYSIEAAAEVLGREMAKALAPARPPTTRGSPTLVDRAEPATAG